jgi:hypothetical protein
MTRHLIIILIFLSTISACGQMKFDDSKSGIIIDPKIKADVEKNISPSEFGEGQDKVLIYNNLMLLDFYEDDKLNISLKEQDKKSTVFKSFYYWQDGTLGIDGAFGLFGGTGFSIKIDKNKATLYHMLASDDFPSYAYKENDSLIFRLEVPCTETKIILSEIPDSGKNQIIYGYVEFKSGDYYISSGSVDGQEILPRKKQRANMRVYFKSAKLDL